MRDHRSGTVAVLRRTGVGAVSDDQVLHVGARSGHPDERRIELGDEPADLVRGVPRRVDADEHEPDPLRGVG